MTRKWHKKGRKLKGFLPFFILQFYTEGVMKMSINEYIKSTESLSLMPYMTIFLAIIQLAKDGYINYDGERIYKVNDPRVQS